MHKKTGSLPCVSSGMLQIPRSTAKILLYCADQSKKQTKIHKISEEMPEVHFRPGTFTGWTIRDKICYIPAAGQRPAYQGKDTSQLMKAIVTVIGKDQVGIIASVCALLAGEDINVLNISQSVLQEYFVMVMLVDLSGCQTAITEISGRLDKAGQERGLSIRIQREDIFNAMHRI